MGHIEFNSFLIQITSDDIDHGDCHISVGGPAAVAPTICLSNLSCLKYVFIAKFLPF